MKYTYYKIILIKETFQTPKLFFAFDVFFLIYYPEMWTNIHNYHNQKHFSIPFALTYHKNWLTVIREIDVDSTGL